LRSAREPRSKRVGIHEVRERALAIDLHDREVQAVPGLEVGVAGDIDHVELELELLSRGFDDLERTCTEAAVGGVVDDYSARYGYNPRVVVASATRCTARPYDAMRRLVPYVACVCQASSNARATMSWSFAFTSSSRQKYSCRP
jgi:hypothetical protein